MENFFLVLNLIGIAIYLKLLPFLNQLTEIDKNEGKEGIFKRGRFTRGILIVYIVFLSKCFGWNGFFGFGNVGIPVQIIWILWNSRTEAEKVYFLADTKISTYLFLYNIIGISTLIYQLYLLFKSF